MSNDASIKYLSILYEASNKYSSFNKGHIVSCCCYNSNIKDAIDKLVIWYDYGYKYEDIKEYIIEVLSLANLSEHISSTVYIYYI